MTAQKVLVQVITGGRPKLSDRVTATHFDSLKEYGFTDIEWCLREDHVAGYELDDNPLNVYPLEWASEFAKTHWRHPLAEWNYGGFFGAFPGREWAMRSGKERGYDLVLQLDDNVRQLGVVSATGQWGKPPVGEMVAVLTELSMSTNLHMLGMQLSAVQPESRTKIVRVGFPYSVFVEKAQGGRLPYYGPFEDDIMHAMEYGLNGGPGRTAGLAPLLTYVKDSGGKSGMRKHYDATRGLELVRRYPRNAVLRESRKTVSPNDTARGYRHFLKTTGFTPVKITDSKRYAAAAEHLGEMAAEARRAWEGTMQAKIRRRSEGAKV